MKKKQKNKLTNIAVVILLLVGVVLVWQWYSNGESPFTKASGPNPDSAFGLPGLGGGGDGVGGDGVGEGEDFLPPKLKPKGEQYTVSTGPRGCICRALMRVNKKLVYVTKSSSAINYTDCWGKYRKKYEPTPACQKLRMGKWCQITCGRAWPDIVIKGFISTKNNPMTTVKYVNTCNNVNVTCLGRKLRFP